MKYHHVMVLVSDMEQSLRLYRDVLGFEVTRESVLPDDGAISPEIVDALWEREGARSRSVILHSSGGSMLELQQPLAPEPVRTPPENLRYAHTGIHELALEVSGIDGWFEKVTGAGYEAHGVKEVWDVGRQGRTFLFSDPDGNLVQLWETPKD